MATQEAIQEWGSEGIFFSEAARGGPLPWRAGDEMLGGDALGPTRHAHDDAAEYYYMFSGSALCEVGGQERVLGEGELLYIPPDAPHNFFGPASDADACLYALVAPNYANNKWRLTDFLPGSEELRMSVATPFVDSDLPAGGTLSAEAILLDGDTEPITLKLSNCESVYVVVEGVLDMALANGLSGSLSAGTTLHLRSGTEHVLSASDACKVLRLDCGFAEWEGVPLASD
jgi:mannose-6-phosphate isomerase-like protein (cupin superfamily)